MKIGIGVSTTPNRDVINHALWQHLMPDDAKFIIYEDKALTGVAFAKNNLLAQLTDCEHIFLFDDDCHPIAEDWHLPYIESKEPHLMYQFKLPGKPLSDMRELYRDNKIVAYSHTRGAMIYIQRSVLDTVGGFDIAYKQYGYEHPDYTNRIHNAGLTTHRAMDVPNSHRLLYCLDQDAKVDSSLPDSVRREAMANNYRYYRKNKTSKAFKEYRK